MSTAESCRTCKFFYQEVLEKRNFGFCKRFPPTPLAILTISPQGGNTEISKCSPGMGGNEWCGEYKMKVTLQ